MMAQNKARSNREPINYGRFIKQFWPDIITSMQQLERIDTELCRQKISKLFNQIYIYIYIYLHAHVYPHTEDKKEIKIMY